jgi:predicted NBD/HSP70 family sugar kinase/DNA-binding XRE family transcriptional regulator
LIHFVDWKKQEYKSIYKVSKMNIGKPKLIRKINRKIILDAIREEQSFSQPYISRKVGASKQTINKIITNLLNENLVVEAGIGESTKEGGKKPLLLKFNPKGGYVIGIILNHKITAVLTDLSANIISEKTIPINLKLGRKEVFTSITKLIKNIINEIESKKDKIFGIGIGIPGITSNKEIRFLPRFSEWKNYMLVDELSNELGIKIFIENDNRLRIFGEKWFGLAKNVNNFATIYIDEGFGAGFFCEDSIITGANYLSGEIGHIKLKRNGLKCGCGNNGCLETLVNLNGVKNLFKEKTSTGEIKHSSFYDNYKNLEHLITFDVLFDYFHKGDQLAQSIVKEITFWLGVGISIIVSTLDPDLIIINGPYISAGESLLKELKDILRNHYLPGIKKDVNLKFSQLGEKAGLFGAVGMVLDNTL